MECGYPGPTVTTLLYQWPLLRYAPSIATDIMGREWLRLAASLDNQSARSFQIVQASLVLNR